MASSSSVVSVPVRLKNTEQTRSSASPERSIASIVLAKLGASELPAIASISALFAARATSKAGWKCAGFTSAKGGASKGPVHGASNGLSETSIGFLEDSGYC